MARYFYTPNVDPRRDGRVLYDIEDDQALTHTYQFRTIATATNLEQARLITNALNQYQTNT